MRGAAMPRYYLHLRDDTDEVLDSEGIELAGVDELKKIMMAAARDVIAGDVRNGLLDLRFRIDAEDRLGAIVHSLPFAQALNIIPEGNAAT
jgi:hypothetical protein